MINGAEVYNVNGFQVLSPKRESAPATILVSFDAHDYDIALGAEDFKIESLNPVRPE